MVHDTSKSFVSNNPNYGMWWETYMSSIHSCIRNDVKSDPSISFELMVALMRFLELSYMNAKNVDNKI